MGAEALGYTSKQCLNNKRETNNYFTLIVRLSEADEGDRGWSIFPHQVLYRPCHFLDQSVGDHGWSIFHIKLYTEAVSLFGPPRSRSPAQIQITGKLQGTGGPHGEDPPPRYPFGFTTSQNCPPAPTGPHAAGRYSANQRPRLT